MLHKFQLAHRLVLLRSKHKAVRLYGSVLSRPGFVVYRLHSGFAPYELLCRQPRVHEPVPWANPETVWFDLVIRNSVPPRRRVVLARVSGSSRSRGIMMAVIPPVYVFAPPRIKICLECVEQRSIGRSNGPQIYALAGVVDPPDVLRNKHIPVVVGSGCLCLFRCTENYICRRTIHRIDQACRRFGIWLRKKYRPERCGCAGQPRSPLERVVYYI